MKNHDIHDVNIFNKTKKIFFYKKLIFFRLNLLSLKSTDSILFQETFL